MQFQVPQNIDLEDKIIGPLTLKQFIILMVGGMFDYMWYTFFDSALFVILMIPTTVLTLALVFAKVQEEPFPKFLVNFFLFTLKPKILTWGETLKPKIIETKKTKKETFTPKIATGSQIEQLSKIVDTQGWNGTEIKTEPTAVVPAIAPLSPIKQTQKSQSMIDKIITPKKPQPAQYPRPVIPQISQPQPIKTSFSKRIPGAPGVQPVISAEQVNKIAAEVGQQENISQEKIKAAAEAIIAKLKTTPPQNIKPKEAFWKNILDKIIQKPSGRQLLKAQIISPEDLEKELGLADRVKTHEAIKPKLNLGPASENNPEDPLEKTDT